LTGRGEYEISEASAEGYNPSDIVDRRITLDFGSGLVIDSDSVLRHQGGKWRIRRLRGTTMHPHLQVAAVLMMPKPVREERVFGRGLPVMRQDQYAIEHIETTQVALVGSDAVRLRIGEITLRNASQPAYELDFSRRAAEISRIWSNADDLPDELVPLIHEHQVLVTAGGPIPRRASQIVNEMQHIVTISASDYAILQRTETEDVVPDLIRIIGEGEDPPEPGLAVESIEPEEIQIRQRVIKEYKRWANSRGPASVRFRRAVRDAYRSTCIVCGVHLPSTKFNGGPGVDSAHIVPWAKADLDEVSNGICLCKHHHWAFDEGLIEISYASGTYYVEIPDAVSEGITSENPNFSLENLRMHTGAIPEDRLPFDPRQRPNPRCLELLREYN
jgi:hypothetical protein